MLTILLGFTHLAAEPIKVGVLIPMSGLYADFGREVREGIQKADSLGIQLVYADSGCDAKTAMSEYLRLTKTEGIKILLGPTCGSPQRTLAPLIKRDGLVSMLTSSSSQTLFRMSGERIFSPQYSIESDGRFIAEQVNKREHKTAFLVYTENEYSRAYQQAFRKYFNGEVLGEFVYSGTDPNSMRDAAVKIKSSTPESVFLPDATPMMHGLMTQLRKIGVMNTPTFSNYGIQQETVINVEKDAVNGVYYSYPNIPNNDAFSYFPKLGAEMLFQALRTCGPTPDCVAKTLQQDLGFSEDGVKPGKIVLKQIQDGKFIVVSR